MKMLTKMALTGSMVVGILGTTASAHFIGVGGNNSIDGSLCVGNDCVAEEAFGFDTIRLKENNLRLHFQDTSTSASFPTNDWRIIINDSSNGGAGYFGVEDSDGGNIPFRVSAGARNNALFVDSQGDVGVGTATPATDIDIKIGDSPTVRLQQDGSSGFQPQTWDLAGNETNFFIRDVTNGSLLPFRIRPDAPSNSLMIEEDGSIGLGTASPTEKLDVRNGNIKVTDGNLLLSQSGAVNVTFTDTDDPGADVRIQHQFGTLNFSFIGSGATEMSLDDSGNLTLSGGLISTGGGGACTAVDPCDRVFDTSVYQVPSIEDHAREMWAKKHLPAVGPTGPDQPLNVTLKLVRMLNELEHAHIYIEQLNTRITELEAAVKTAATTK